MPMQLADNIKSIRKKWKLKQEEFGEIFELGRGSISTYEGGVNEPKIKFLLRLYELTGISIYDICTRKLDKTEIPTQPLNTPPGRSARVLPTPDPGKDFDSRLTDIEAELASLKKFLGKE